MKLLYRVKKGCSRYSCPLQITEICGDSAVLISGKKWNISILSVANQPAAEEENVVFHFGSENIDDTYSNDDESILAGIASPPTLVCSSSLLVILIFIGPIYRSRNSSTT